MFFLLGKTSVTHKWIYCCCPPTVSNFSFCVMLMGNMHKVHEPSEAHSGFLFSLSQQPAVGPCAHLWEEAIESILYLTSLPAYIPCPMTKIFKSICLLLSTNFLHSILIHWFVFLDTCNLLHALIIKSVSLVTSETGKKMWMIQETVLSLPRRDSKYLPKMVDLWRRKIGLTLW